MIYNKNNLNVAKIVSKNKMRIEISGVLFTKDKTVATDSFRLIEISTPKGLNYNDFPFSKGEGIVSKGFEPFIADASDLKKIVIPKKGSLPILHTTVIGSVRSEAVNFTTSDIESTDNVIVRKIKGEYPKYEEIIPTGKPLVTFTVNAEYLIGVLEVLGKLERGHKVEMKFYGETKPMVLEAGNEEIQKGRAVIMGIN